LDAEYADFQRSINQINVDLVATQDKINQTDAYET
jgi:hypothetical protein